MNAASRLVPYSDLPWLSLFNQTIDQPQNFPALLTSYGVDIAMLSSIAEKPNDVSEAYGRKVLFKNNEIEVMLASWAFHAMALPHNHGASKGLIWFAEGDFSEQHYRFQNGELHKQGPAVKFGENQVVRVDSNDIHSCRPEKTGLSLHIYSPPIEQMKVWDLDSKRTLTVSDNCGAWIPKNLNLIVSETAW